MIKKIVTIKNFGKYKNYSKSPNWNGLLEKVNAIYADNATGKTTLTQLFKSLKGDNELIRKRKSFGSSEPIDILLINDNNVQIKFSKSKWNLFMDNIEVFDSFFIESNVYLITLGNYDQKGNLFEIVVGTDGIELYESIAKLRSERKALSQKRRNYRNAIKKTDDPVRIESLEDKIVVSLKKSKEIAKEIIINEKQLVIVAENFGRNYLDKINEYLKYFNPNIQLTKLNKKGTKFVYYLKIKDYDIRSDSESISLKHTLSEGDKSSLALSFFLARLSLQDNIQDKLIIFDDPISSFDYSRRNVTLNFLHSFSKKANQFILLSHDINFVKDFSQKCQSVLNLKISFKGDTSVIEKHDIYTETLTGIFKDLTVLYNFIENGESSEFDKREVVRCIRPSIEGIFRIKFFKEFTPNNWLGDMIKLIQDSKDGDIFYHLKSLIDELIDVNDYSKSYHHSSPNYLEIPINNEELRNYTIRTLNLIRKI